MDKNCMLCPWVQDAENPNRYVCLKCGKEKNIDRPNIEAPIWFILAVIFGLIIQTTILEKQPQIQNPSSPTSINTK